MKFLKYIFAALFVFFLFNSAGFCRVSNFEKNPNPHTVTFSAGTLLQGILQEQLSSANNSVGDKVYLLMPSDIKIGKITCIPKKSIITGQIIQAQKAREGKNGFIQIRFDSIEFPDGWGTQLLAHVWNNEATGVIGGETTKRSTYRKIPHYIESMGIIAQLIETGPRITGKEKFIPAGTEFVIVLDNDLKVVPD